VPLSYERLHYRAPARLTTSRPLFVDIAFHEWSDIGLELFGRLARFGYDLALVNGPSGLTEAGVPNFDEIDINRDKTVVARLNFYPTDWIEAGIAGALGAYAFQGGGRFRLAEADARVRRGPLDVWAEVDWRNADSEPCSFAADAACPATYAGDHGNKLGYYLLASYDLVRSRPYAHYLRPLVRFDAVSDLVAGVTTRRVTGGLDWSPLPHVVVKAEYQWRFGSGVLGVMSDGVMASVVADF
jgi:hypothetical protein